VGPEDDGEGRNWLALIGGAVAVVFTIGAGIFTFFSTMETPLHTSPADLPSIPVAAPLPQWADAVETSRRIAREGLIERNLPGLSVAVGIGGDVVWAEGFGWADLEKRVPLAPHMRFRIGHVSKAVTSAAVGLLLEQGRLDLDEQIHTYVPAFPLKQWPVTLRQVMAHVAGIRHYDSDLAHVPTTHCERASEGLSPFADDPLRFEPETQYRYSTFGWILVSAAVEAAANQPFFTFMREKIFQPLGMDSTTTDAVTPSIPNLATFYDPRFSGDPAFGPRLSPTVDYSCYAGAGAFLSTPSDLVRFGLAVSGGALLKPDTVTRLQMPQQLLSGEETAYGLGWMLETFVIDTEPERVAGHASRTMLGSSTSFITFPDCGIVVAVMSNTSDTTLRPIALNIAKRFGTRGP
jgi:serine beta-lactamase-like protein LACTB